jgi:hypothetical protein
MQLRSVIEVDAIVASAFARSTGQRLSLHSELDGGVRARVTASYVLCVSVGSGRHQATSWNGLCYLLCELTGISRMLLCMVQSLRRGGLQAKIVSSQSKAAVQNTTGAGPN